MNRPTFSILLQTFFSDHLIQHKRCSPQTISSYRDTFRLFLNFVLANRKILPSSLQTDAVDVPLILAFLDQLETQRQNSVRSRNLRLAAIRSFFRYVALRDPESVSTTARILAIPSKRADHRIVSYLTRPEMDAILSAPDCTTWLGRRDHALLLSFYNTGARVSELKALKRDSVNFGASSSLHLRGKGRKDREVPLWSSTARVLRSWFDEVSQRSVDLAFPNARGAALSTDGIAYILNANVKRATPHCPTLAAKRVTPHVIRHTTAMHLLQSGIDMSVIALWLGHETIETTHIYVEADLSMKERALDKLAPPNTSTPRFQADDALLAFLSSI